MIRNATIDDITILVAMGQRFHAETICAQQTSFDEDSFASTLKALLSSPQNRVFVLVDNDRIIGMAAIVFMPCYFNSNHITANELFCWVEPDHRGNGLALFDALEEHAKNIGAITMIIALVPNMRMEALDRLYKARGFIQTDIFYTKVL